MVTNNTNNLDWVDAEEDKRKEESDKGFFKIVEGDNKIQLLTHCAPLAQVWIPSEKKYRIAVEGDKTTSIKGICWVLHEGVIKQARLPYKVVKDIRGLMQDDDYAFEGFPMPRPIKIVAVNAGTKEVEYSVIPGPKEVKVPTEILDELYKKPSPEELVEKYKGKSESVEKSEVNPDDIPF